VAVPDTGLETAGSHASRNVPTCAPGTRAGAARQAFAHRRFESAASIAICDGDTLVGVVTLEELLAAPDDQPLSELMDADPPVVAPGVDREVAAWRAVTRRETALAVVDERRRFLGMIPPQELLAILLHEHDEDVARLGGFLHSSSQARHALEEPVWHRVGHRAPWLLVGLAGMLMSAQLVGAFEAALQRDVMVAFFVPGVVYLADAVGTQTETLFVRGLSVGVSMRHVVWRELLTGWLIALAIAASFFPIALWWWERADLAISVSVGLLVACSMASAIAMVIPWSITRAGWDPALGSGPLATVIQDLASIAVYLIVAMRVVG
jgi:magnesium transporter